MTAAKARAVKAAAADTASRLVKIGADGTEIAADAAEWDAVLDRRTGLMWLVRAMSVKNWRAPTIKTIEKELAELHAGGFSDWRIPSVEELFTIADRTRTSPAIDVDFFPDCPSDWFWTSTPYAPSPGGYAWSVGFYGGSANYGNRGGSGFVRAVRAGQ